MFKKIIFVLIVIICICVLIGMSVLKKYFPKNPDGQLTAVIPSTNQVIEFNQDFDVSDTRQRYRVEEVVGDLFVPWSIVFTSPERMLITERNGSIQVVENGQKNSQPLYRFSEVSTTGEEGLMGLALDPEYQSNRFLYVSLAYPKANQLVLKVVRLTDQSEQATNPTTIIDDIPAARFHAGSRLKFGPDQKLYVTTGDAIDRNIAQDPSSLGGKILRLNSDGSIPVDNPFPNSYVYSLGHRNPQGIDWHPETKQLFSTEHGPSGFDGPGGGDELNLVVAGGNFGWPIVSHERTKEGFIDPLLLFTPAVAPASGMFYTSDVLPHLKGSYLFGGLKSEGIVQVSFSQKDSNKVERFESLVGIDVGRVREVTQGPEGFIYFSSSNRDGRGNNQQGDDKIYRIRPMP